jgi:hypothetical protein
MDITFWQTIPGEMYSINEAGSEAPATEVRLIKTFTVPSDKRGLITGCSLALTPTVGVASTGRSILEAALTPFGSVELSMGAVIQFESGTKSPTFLSSNLMIPIKEGDVFKLVLDTTTQLEWYWYAALIHYYLFD